MPEGGNNETEEFNIEFALLGIRVQLVFLKASKNLANMDFSFFGILRQDENVVQMYYCEFIEDISKTIFVKRWKVAGALVRSKCLTMRGAMCLTSAPFTNFR